ncbi:MgtC/SapB family protein [Mucilaginibacter sp. X5P1]|uniref:MgtC/SapB family protein n=1 Tax=Mucilaginibacter sp. X5P1 TaxID=2723088 RepID=UPI0016196B29|nr:MgtC/SapB family protein [Mucilaginibacter sp. X5P1]MBB6137986.1 putative Mg2+ transporter-C (MgtC) family protein [Mucilaginibacter sp. X5P1]
MNLNHFWTDTSQSIYGNELVKLTLSVVAGSILGLEREIRGKSAGFRTLALICFGATIFTICSYLLGVEDNRDRIAANVITGIGFIGAGVIFRNNSSISGITTAASIWVSASIGMLLGIGNFLLAGVALIFALFILYILDFIQFWIDYKFQHRNYNVVFRDDCPVDMLEEQVKSLKLNFNKTKMLRNDKQTVFQFEVWGKESSLFLFNQWLFDNKSILSFEW